MLFQIMSMKDNPYIWDPSAENVTTGAMIFAMDSCATAQRRKRRSTFEATVGLDVGMTVPSDKYLFVDHNTSDTFGMLTHIYNLSKPGINSALLIVSYRQTWNESLFIYIRANEYPTPNDYTWIATVKDNSSSIETSNGTRTIKNTLYFSANETFNVSRLYVSVQSSAGEL